MKTTIRLLIFALTLSALASAQVTTTSTTVTAAVGLTDEYITVASATGITAPTTPLNATTSAVMIDGEYMPVTSLSGTRVGVTRGGGGRQTTHASGALTWVGAPNYFSFQDPQGSCAASQNVNLPRPSIQSGRVYDCQGGQWGEQVYSSFYISPSNCSFAPTTSTVTVTWPQIGASTLFVVNGTTNAAAGTTTLTCNIYVPSHVAALKGAYISDITLFVGSQTTAPTSLGTSTLGSITFPAAATTETESTVTPVTIGGTVTTTSPTAITTVTTAGAFLTIKHTYSTAVRLSTDNMILRYTMPFAQSAAAAMVLNSPGLLVHYRAALN